ncbi:MAG: PHP domain-containing protein, partial [Treponema porcinum]|nr:PHP domain-containing protein [Treponema porcinum]
MADIPHFDDPPEGTPVSQFVHLHVHSDYSLLDSTAKLSSLVKRAKELNMPALALTDHGNMFGVLNFEHICHANGINPIVGCEFYVTETDHKVQERTKYGGKYYHLILLCENETGYKNMSWLCSNAYTEGLHYGKPNIDFEMLKERHEGLICLSACIQGQVPQALLHDDDEWAEEVARKYSELFGPDHYYIELQDHGLPDQKIAAEKLINLAEKLNLPLVVTNDIHYCNKDDAEAQDALRCIGFKRLLDEPH